MLYFYNTVYIAPQPLSTDHLGPAASDVHEGEHHTASEPRHPNWATVRIELDLAWDPKAHLYNLAQ